MKENIQSEGLFDARDYSTKEDIRSWELFEERGFKSYSECREAIPKSGEREVKALLERSLHQSGKSGGDEPSHLIMDTLGCWFIRCHDFIRCDEFVG